jgi:hypothetical protein
MSEFSEEEELPPVPEGKPEPIPTNVPFIEKSEPPTLVLETENRVVDLTPVIMEPEKFLVTDNNIPLISYVHLAFANIFNTAGSDLEKWKKLPEIVRRDVLLHCDRFGAGYCKGQAEAMAINPTNDLLKEFGALNRKQFKSVDTGLSFEFVKKGTEIIDFYYSRESISNPTGFIEKFKELPQEGRFYDYVYQMAKEARVHIEDWDHEFAKYNWQRGTMIHLSVQALERCLHERG